MTFEITRALLALLTMAVCYERVKQMVSSHTRLLPQVCYIVMGIASAGIFEGMLGVLMGHELISAATMKCCIIGYLASVNAIFLDWLWPMAERRKADR